MEVHVGNLAQEFSVSCSVTLEFDFQLFHKNRSILFSLFILTAQSKKWSKNLPTAISVGWTINKNLTDILTEILSVFLVTREKKAHNSPFLPLMSSIFVTLNIQSTLDWSFRLNIYVDSKLLTIRLRKIGQFVKNILSMKIEAYLGIKIVPRN